MAQRMAQRGNEPPILLVKWYDVTKWLLERVDSFPKNQRFIFGQRIADRTLNILEVLVEAAYSPRKADLLARANRDIEVLRWLVRMASRIIWSFISCRKPAGVTKSTRAPSNSLKNRCNRMKAKRPT
jgi:hypothetical protein